MEQDGAREAKRLKMPKRVAGVKLPKPLRRAAEDALAQLTSSTGRLLLASALEAAAALRRGAGETAGERPAVGSTVDRVGPMIGLAANALGSWLGDVARKPAPPAPPAEPTPEPGQVTPH